MREIVSFKKEIEFKTMISRITGISLDHTLEVNDHTISGDFVVSGTYRMTSASQIEEDFSYKVPVDIEVDDKYETKELSVDIDDFTYEVLNEEILLVKIDLCLDHLELKEEPEVVEEKIDPIDELEEILFEDDSVEEKEEELVRVDDVIVVNHGEESKTDVEEYKELPIEDLFKEVETTEKLEIPVNVKEDITVEEKEEFRFDPTKSDSIFMNLNDGTESFSTYHIHIVREGDSVDSILNKYKTTKECLEEYNNLNELKLGTKVIIPAVHEE